jgi:starch synthase
MRTFSVVMAAAEAVPFTKTGGLGDVAGALPRALADRGVRVRLVVPYHTQASLWQPDRPGSAFLMDVTVEGKRYRVTVYRTAVTRRFEILQIKHDRYFNRPFLYGPPGEDYVDNARRFAFFSRAVARYIERLDEPVDLVHLHDWHTALLPLVLSRRIPSVLTIHNLAFQGLFPPEALGEAGLSRDLFLPDLLEFWGRVNFLKAGILFADRVAMVSPAYLEEVLSEPLGYGLEGFLRAHRHKLRGILNGVDHKSWNPAADPLIPARYDAADREGKEVCRRALQEEFGLPSDLPGPLVGLTTRLTHEKGIDLVLEALPALRESGCTLVAAGTGEARFEEALRAAAAQSAHVRFEPGYDEAVAHRIMAGADVFLQPSRREPCGLNILYAMKYGTVPVVADTGGFRDTVTPVTGGNHAGTGFVFSPGDAGSMVEAIRRAAAAFGGPAWTALIGRCMDQDFSWDRPVDQYLELYRDLVPGGGRKERRPHR